MGTLLVVGDHPAVEGFVNLVQFGEEVGVEHLPAHAAVEALDVGVLGGFARLDVVEADSVQLAPGHELRGDELRAVVDADLLGQLMAVLELLQDADDTHRRKRCFHLDGKRLVRRGRLSPM